MRKIVTILGLLAIIGLAVLVVFFRPKGSLEITSPGGVLVLGSIFGPVSVTPGKIVPVAVGNHRPTSLSVTCTSGQESYTLSCSNHFGKLSNIEIAKNKTTKVEFGPPFDVNADLQKIGKSVTVGLTIQGVAGETYSPLITANGRGAQAPKVIISDANGNTLASGKFSYG